MSNDKPIKRFRAGSVEAAVWKNEQVDQNGQTVERHSVTIRKSYRDKESGQWKQSDSFFPSDLPRLALVVQKAFEFVSLNESE